MDSTAQPNPNSSFFDGEPDFWDVRAGSYGSTYRVKRFPATERGKRRAQEYAENFNKRILSDLNLTHEDLSIRKPDYESRPDEYEKSLQVDLFWEARAVVIPEKEIPVVGDDDPMPTDYEDYEA